MHAGRANRAVDLRIDAAAEASAEAVKAARDPPAALGRFLVRLGDRLQTGRALEPRAPALHPWIKK